MNVLMIAMTLIGAMALWRMRRETFPAFELEIVMVSVVYPGATPNDTEEAICQKIEEAIRAIDGIKKVTSIAQEGAAFVIAELRSDVHDVQKVMSEIDREVNRIPSFPALAEDPVIQQITFREPAIRIGIIGPNARDREREIALRSVAEQVRDEVLLIPAVSSATIMGARSYQIDVEISESTLRSYGLSLGQVATMLREHNIELPGGQLKSEGQEILLRAKSKGTIGEEIAKLPLVTGEEGVVLTVADLGTVRDEFEDVTSTSEINGEPALVVSVERTKREDLLGLVDAVRKYASNAKLPDGYRMVLWGDTSRDVRDRLSLLMRNGAQGLVLVFVVLALFLEMRLAFWVALGIPISICVTGIFLALGDQTLNMLSLFSFLIALGIVVDDAIVVGENVYSHRQMNKPMWQAAVDGTVEVFPSVFASVATTVIAFGPMFFVSGVMGKFMAVIPFAVIAMLTISLFESTFSLPCHLSHRHHGFFRLLSWLLYPLRPIGLLLESLNRLATNLLEKFIVSIYLPALRFSISHPTIPTAIAITMIVVTIGMIRGGVVPTILFPKTDSNQLQASITFPDGTPAAETELATREMEQAIRKISQELAEEQSAIEGRPVEEIFPAENGILLGPVRLTFRQVGAISSTDGPLSDGGGTGSNVGQVMAELHDTTIRTVHSDRILALWRERVGEFPGAEKLTYGSVSVTPGGKAIEFKLLAPSGNVDELLAATDAVKQRLGEFTGVFDIVDDNLPGKWEYQFRVKDEAIATGVTATDLGETVRSAYFGAEVMRLQRGRHEVKLMVRYPEEERQSLVDFREVRVRTADGVERPITELAEIVPNRGFSEINRVDQMRSITIAADIDEVTANADLIIGELQKTYVPKLQEMYPNVRIRWEGQREQSNESVGSLKVGFAVAIVCMFVLLVLQFRSYAQPLLILAIIPFGMIGAVWGHALLGLPITLFSMFGLVALAGVVVNDSIVLIEFINTRIRDGLPYREAILDAGQRRFRPILLTSATTVAGLLPLITEKSFQAQLLIPMAASLGFGLVLSTVLVLLLIPVFYLFYRRLTDILHVNKVEYEE
jgi:multidrug efflux pump subunit AcrB